MRRVYWLFLLLGLAACSARPLPPEVVLDASGYGAFEIQADAPFTLETPAWLAATPARGQGPLRVDLAGDGRDLPNVPEVTGEIRVFTNRSYRLPVRWPLLRLTGVLLSPRPRATLPARGLSLPKAIAPAGLLVKTKDGRWKALPPGAVPPEDARYVEQNGRVWPLGVPGDPYYPIEWHLRATGARWALDAQSRFTDPVVVAVIDTGVRYDHPDLAGALFGPGDGAYDFVEDDDDPTDTVGAGPAVSHGTHVTGLIAARANGVGVVGVAAAAPVKVLPLRVIGAAGGTFADVADAIRYAAGLPVTRTVNGRPVTLTNPHPARVINLSLGSTQYSRAMCEAVADAVAAGTLVVAAAGNNGGREYFYPASCSGAISVAATDQGFTRAPLATWYSEKNDRISLAAPGGDLAQDADHDGVADGIASTTWSFDAAWCEARYGPGSYPDGCPSYGLYMGTSQAAPQVAAALALLISAGERDPWAALKNHLTDLGPEGKDAFYGEGFLNLAAALGLTPPPGDYLIEVRGRTPRVLRVRPDQPFTLYLPAGTYTLIACRDDDQNRLCNAGEPGSRTRLALSKNEIFTLLKP